MNEMVLMFCFYFAGIMFVMTLLVQISLFVICAGIGLTSFDANQVRHQAAKSRTDVTQNVWLTDMASHRRQKRAPDSNASEKQQYMRGIVTDGSNPGDFAGNPTESKVHSENATTVMATIMKPHGTEYVGYCKEKFNSSRRANVAEVVLPHLSMATAILLGKVI